MGQCRIQSWRSLMKNDQSRPPYCRLHISCKSARQWTLDALTSLSIKAVCRTCSYPELASFRPRYNDSLPAGAVGVDVRGRFCRDRCVKVSQSLLRLRRRKGENKDGLILLLIYFVVAVGRLPARRVRDLGRLGGHGDRVLLTQSR